MLHVRIETATEHPEEREHRLRELRRDAALRRFKELGNLVVLSGFTVWLAVLLGGFLSGGHGR